MGETAYDAAKRRGGKQLALHLRMREVEDYAANQMVLREQAAAAARLEEADRRQREAMEERRRFAEKARLYREWRATATPSPGRS